MTPERLSLRLRMFLFFALIGLGACAMIAGAMYAAAARIGSDAAVGPLVLFGGAAGFGILLLTAWVWQLFDENVARAIETLSGELSATAAGGAPPPADRARYLGELGPAAERLGAELRRARGEAGDAVAEAVDDVLAEKTQLEAVLRDLRECVLICNPSHEILLYNAEAQRLLGAGSVGLGRSLFSLVSEAPVAHALERLQKRFTSGRYRTHRDRLSVAVTCATRDGARTLAGRVALILDEGESRVDGFVVTLHDATAAIADEAARDHLIREMLEEMRRPAAAVRAAVETLEAEPEMDAGARARFMEVLGEESGRLATRLEAMAESFNELRVGGWSMADMSSEAIVDCVADRVAGGQGPDLAHEGPRRWLHCDSFTVVELLARIAETLGRAGVRRIALSAEAAGGHVYLDLHWDGPPADFAERDAWLDAPLADSLGALSARDVLAHHRTALWAETAGGRQRLRLPLPPAVEDHENAPAEVLPARPEFYDFALLRRGVSADIRDRALAETSFTVFDTETTGLFPSAGDEIVQIAGVRMLGTRVLRGEVFDRLVDPGRRIPAASTKIHGITDAMVEGQGDARRVLPEFHGFAEGSVLVAHNAPFDMTFLRLKEGATGARFDQPVLDTVLLSAWCFGQSAEHTLDALAARFDVAIPEGLRHTALADAMVTAEVLSGLLGVLKARGIVTLGEAMSVSEEAGAIRRRQAASV